MNKLQNNSFRNIEQKPIYEQYYSYFLNKLLEYKKENKCTTELLSKAFSCSKGTISNFENRVKDYDFVMLFKYAAFFQYNLTMNLDKKTYSEIMNN